MTNSNKNFNSEFIVEGMHCASCELLIEEKLSQVEGVNKVDAKLNESKVYLQSSKLLNAQELSKLVEENGYRIVEKKSKRVINKKQFVIGFLIAAIVFILFLVLQKLGIVNIAKDSEITYPFIFFIGIIASVSTCMAVVGGLVLSISTNYSKNGKTIPLIGFHFSRLISFFVLGGVIGLVGTAATLSPTASFILNTLLFLVMLIMALNLLDLFDFTKKLQLKMPKFAGKNIIKLSQSDSLLTPVLLGAATFFLPCGFTQSMQLYSLTTGSVLNGAFTMFVFALGTLPVLALISFASIKFSKTMQSGLFYKTAAFLILFFAVFNLISALISIGLIPPILNF